MQLLQALQEAKSLIRLDMHPHVVTYMDTWLHRDTPVSPFTPAINELCIMMEFCPNGDLFDRLERDRAKGAVPFAKIATWAGQACEAVRYIHSKGITHCDLKLENFFLGENDVVKLGEYMPLSRRLCWLSPLHAPTAPASHAVCAKPDVANS